MKATENENLDCCNKISNELKDGLTDYTNEFFKKIDKLTLKNTNQIMLFTSIKLIVQCILNIVYTKEEASDLAAEVHLEIRNCILDNFELAMKLKKKMYQDITHKTMNDKFTEIVKNSPTYEWFINKYPQYKDFTGQDFIENIIIVELQSNEEEIDDIKTLLNIVS